MDNDTWMKSIKFVVYDDVTGIRESEHDTLKQACEAAIASLQDVYDNPDAYPPAEVVGTTTVYKEVTLMVPAHVYAIDKDGVLEVRE